MSKKAERIMTQIPKFCHRRTLDVLMFGYVEGVRSVFPTVSVNDALVLFQGHYRLTEEDYSISTARVTYYRMIKEVVKL